MTKHNGPDLLTADYKTIARWSAHKLGDDRWTGSIELKDGSLLELEELPAAEWNVTDETKKTIGTGSSLQAALKKAGIR